jgi:hypothetical protein
MTSLPVPAAFSMSPFLPSRDFGQSKAFYKMLGFETLLDEEVAIFAMAGSRFILQNYYQEDWAANFMMQLMVPDLAAWWAHIEALDLPGRLGVPSPRAPAMQPWGFEVAYLIDPAGVLWHVVQAPEGWR